VFCVWELWKKEKKHPVRRGGISRGGGKRKWEGAAGNEAWREHKSLQEDITGGGEGGGNQRKN